MRILNPYKLQYGSHTQKSNCHCKRGVLVQCTTCGARVCEFHPTDNGVCCNGVGEYEYVPNKMGGQHIHTQKVLELSEEKDRHKRRSRRVKVERDDTATQKLLAWCIICMIVVIIIKCADK